MLIFQHFFEFQTPTAKRDGGPTNKSTKVVESSGRSPGHLVSTLGGWFGLVVPPDFFFDQSQGADAPRRRSGLGKVRVRMPRVGVRNLQ